MWCLVTTLMFEKIFCFYNHSKPKRIEHSLHCINPKSGLLLLLAVYCINRINVCVCVHIIFSFSIYIRVLFDSSSRVFFMLHFLCIGSVVVLLLFMFSFPFVCSDSSLALSLSSSCSLPFVYLSFNCLFDHEHKVICDSLNRKRAHIKCEFNTEICDGSLIVQNSRV